MVIPTRWVTLLQWFVPCMFGLITMPAQNVTVFAG